MYRELTKHLAESVDDASVRVVLLSGEGEFFTAGNDVADFMAPLPDGKLPVIAFLEALRDFPKPIVACINGPAVGVGVTLLLHCDICIAADTATFHAPFAEMALVPEAGASHLLPLAIGPALAHEVLLAGRKLTAEEALSAGLLSRRAAPSDIRGIGVDIAAHLAAQAPNAMQVSKALIRTSRAGLTAQMDAEFEAFLKQLKSPEFAEAMTARMERRAPVFT
jgi:enoyl-CoA hydratase/carnithine racemase